MITVIASRQFLPWALVILGSAHGRRPAQSHGCGITPSRQLQHQVISHLRKLNRQQTSDNIPATPLPYMFRPDFSLTSLVSNYRKQCSSKSNKVSLLQYLHSAQRLRRISFQGNCLFFHVAVNSIHLFSPKLKQNSCIVHPKVVRNKHRLIVFSEINYFYNWLLSFERIDCYDKKKFKAG